MCARVVPHALPGGTACEEIERAVQEVLAGRLGVAVTTVRAHLSSLYKKLQVKSRVALALSAVQASGLAA